MRSSTLALWPLFLSLACTAQTVPANRAPEPNGIVTGRVFCGDTGRPARFASVSLMPVPEPAQTKLNKPEPASTSKPAPGTATTSIAVDTALDGSYTLVHIAPGTYYVIVRMNGYISPLTLFSKKQLDQPTDQERALIESALPKGPYRTGLDRPRRCSAPTRSLSKRNHFVRRRNSCRRCQRCPPSQRGKRQVGAHQLRSSHGRRNRYK